MKEDGGHRNRNITNYIAGLRITQLCLWSMSSEESKIFFFFISNIKILLKNNNIKKPDYNDQAKQEGKEQSSFMI